jgi:hypothetical protein
MKVVWPTGPILCFFPERTFRKEMSSVDIEPRDEVPPAEGSPFLYGWKTSFSADFTKKIMRSGYVGVSRCLLGPVTIGMGELVSDEEVLSRLDSRN